MNYGNEVIGKRIRLIKMAEGEIKAPIIEPNSTGTVLSVDGIGQLHIKWDNTTSSLGVLPDVDEFEFIN